ncbi:MAG: hypothetical protein DIU80_005755 [Chloroflexota bacterium]
MTWRDDEARRQPGSSLTTSPPATRRPLEQPIDELAPRRPRPAGSPAGTGRGGRRKTLREMLATPGMLRHAMLLREVLGPQKALE